MRKVAPSGNVPVCVVTAAKALAEKQSRSSITAEMERGCFVMYHLRGDPAFEFGFSIRHRKWHRLYSVANIALIG